MTLILTAVGRVRDWKALRDLRLACLGRATSVQIYRDVRDASWALVVAELSDDDTRDLEADLRTRIGSLVDIGFADDRIWEAIDTGGAR